MSATEKKEKGKWKRFVRVYRRALGLVMRESGSFVAIESVKYTLSYCSFYWGVWFSAKLLDEVVVGRAPQRLFLYVVLLLGGDLALRFLENAVNRLSNEKEFEFNQKQNMIFAGKVMSLDYSLLEEEKTHTLYRRVVRETFNDRRNLIALRYALPELLSKLVGLGLCAAILAELLRSLQGYGVMAVLLVLLSAGGAWITGKCEAARARIYAECDQSISGNCCQRDGYLEYFNQYERGKEIRIYGIGRLMIDKLMATHHFNDRALDRRAARDIPLGMIGSLSGNATEAVVYCALGFAAITGRITVGDMTKYARIFSRFIMGVSEICDVVVDLRFNVEYLERYFEFLDTPSQMQSGCLPVEKRMDGEYRVAFDHVSFRYPGSETYALRDIHMEFTVGEKMAVVGMNGSGKSTFIKLLCRLYDPTEGVITLNGIDIRRYDYQEYLSLFSVVFQDFKLFSFSLGENVAVAEEYGEERVREALEKSGMAEFLSRSENGLATVLYRDFDSDGVEVSGGEAQKIALARAVCKGSPFVLLDEPTAALDPKAEYEIYKRFNDLVADRTTVYISHRMSSCRFCGDIAVFHEGRMIQRGSHEELMGETQGKYYELWTAQAQYYEEEATEES